MHSKSFAVQLPVLTESELDRLRAWGAENCSQSVLYRDANSIIWLASRERARSREDFARAIRGVLKRLSIDASGLRRRHWLTLTEDSIVRAECAARAAADEPQDDLLGAELSCDEEEDDVRVVPIGRQGPAWFARCRGRCCSKASFLCRSKRATPAVVNGMWE